MQAARVRRPRPLLLAAALCAASLGAAAQSNTKPPKAQLWMDVSTGTMAGMPEMDAGSSMAGMLGGLMGVKAGGGNANTTYGMARGMGIMPPRILDIALYNRIQPGTEAQQVIPPGLRMGASLPLVPPKAATAERTPEGEVPDEYRQEKPKGRILIYWGCGAAVRAGQPRVIDFTKAQPADYAAAFAGRYVPERGPRTNSSFALYPNEKNTVSLGRESSLMGEHQVQGEGIPASMKFTLGAAQDIMPSVDLRSTGTLQDSIQLGWKPVVNARAYYLHALAQNSDDLIIWSSAEAPDTGMGLFDYLPNATIERWVKERVLLQPEATQCAIPQGVFAAGTAGVSGERATPMLRMVAYGGESNFAYPPRPPDPKAPW
ncbi:MAG TPA: hypothetical protein VGC24_05815, partial [Burkholderiaceae bacterium]